MIVLRHAGQAFGDFGNVCDEHGTAHTDTITVYRAHFTGQPVARCEACGWLCAYWECPCEWEHECEGMDQ